MTTNEYHTLCNLDHSTQLRAGKDCFVLSHKASNGYINKYFYAEIGDALRGYARNILKDPAKVKRLDGNVANLMKLIKQLEQTMTKVGDDLQATWEEQLADPVECAIIKKKVR